jgi:A/G-specific adenine glycosylase
MIEAHEVFRTKIATWYAHNRRDFPWRRIHDPYAIYVSEVMLQQTQTHRVEPKFEQWCALFPTWHALADASVAQVLAAWQGLGYNRRALALHHSAQRVIAEFNGSLPADPAVLVTFKGIGKATAASICAFAFNHPTCFIETNIRAVYIHEFFPGRTAVDDKELEPLIKATLDTAHPREWYYALMDYGVMLKKSHGNPSRASKHYSKQSKFEGSDRQIRGAILRALTASARLSFDALLLCSKGDALRLEKQLRALEEEGFIVKHPFQDAYSLKQ